MRYPIYSGALAGVGGRWVNLARLVGVFLLCGKNASAGIAVSFSAFALALCAAAVVNFLARYAGPRRSFICCQAPPCLSAFYLDGSVYRLRPTVDV